MMMVAPLNDIASTVAEAPSTLSLLSNNANIIGSAWVLSSAFLTTYSTTSFLKYKSSTLIDSGNKKKYDDVNESPASLLENGNLAASKFKSSSQLPSPHLSQESEPTLPSLHSPSTSPSNNNKSSPSALFFLKIIKQQIRMARPARLILYRFAGSLFFGIFMHPTQPFQFMQRIQQTMSTSMDFLFPAIFLFIANYSNSIALDRIGISLTYTSKCGIPLITVLLTVLVDGIEALPNTTTLLTLLPIAFGIGAASWNSPTFEKVGFACALLSSTAQAALNVSSKRVIRHTNIGGLDAQRAMVMVALVILCIIQLVNASFQIFRYTSTMKKQEKMTSSSPTYSTASSFPMNNGGTIATTATTTTNTSIAAAATSLEENPPVGITLLAVVSYHIEYVLSFMFVKIVEPITFGACDAIRRLGIILIGRRMFGGPQFSRLNMSGIGCALVGALFYSLASSK